MKSEIVLPASELKSILPGLNKVITRSTLPVLGCVRIDCAQAGDITLQGTNLDDFATARLEEVQTGSPCTVLIPWEPFSKAIKSAGAKEDLILVVDGKKDVKLRTFAGGSQIEQKLETIDVAEWPPTPQVNNPGILLNEDLRQAVKNGFACASEDESRPVINGVCLDVTEPKSHYVVGTNGKVLFSANSFSLNLKESLIIPNRRFLDWSGFIEDADCELSVMPPVKKGKTTSGGWLKFRNERWTFITKQVEGQYPNWKICVPEVKPAATLKLDQAAVENILEVLPRLPGETIMNSPITLAVKGGKLSIVAEGRDDKPVTIPVHDVQIEGIDVNTSINRHHLVKALKFGLNEFSLYDHAKLHNSTPVMACHSGGRRLVIAMLADRSPTPVPPPQPATPEPNERTDMSRTASTQPATETSAPASAAKTVIEQVETIKDTLKGVVSDFNDLLASLKTAEKEKKATEKEIESVRATLRTIQSVKI